MKNPQSIIVDLVRNMNNSKNGNSSIKNWLKSLSNKKEEVKFDVKEKLSLDDIIKEDEETNMLGDNFEEDIIENFENIDIMDEII
jgi:hypothetical protein